MTQGQTIKINRKSKSHRKTIKNKGKKIYPQSEYNGKDGMLTSVWGRYFHVELFQAVLMSYISCKSLLYPSSNLLCRFGTFFLLLHENPELHQNYSIYVYNYIYIYISSR